MIVILDKADVLEAMTKVGIAAEMYDTLEEFLDMLDVVVEDLSNLFGQDIPTA